MIEPGGRNSTTEGIDADAAAPTGSLVFVSPIRIVDAQASVEQR
jgi:hypothetical protein